MIPEAQVLPLFNNATTGMHPALAELQALYNDGKMNIVQGVSYPNPNYSHFRAADIWFSASDGLQYLETGWMGRGLDVQYPDYPVSYPRSEMMDPLAVQIGSTLPFSLQGPHINMGYNVTDPAYLLNVINATTDAAPANDYGRELSFLRLMKDQSNAYTGRIQTAYNAQATQSTQYPATDNLLAEQLKIVARLIGGGLKTPVYVVNHPDTHDTHSNQVVAGNTATGYHAGVLATLSKAIGAFQDDITKMGRMYDVTGMTYSEFGRRIISNASYGTDHGSSAPVMFFGAALNPTMLGTSPNIPLNATVNNQVPMQYDFRQVYATVMQDWLCLTEAETASVLGSTFTKLPIFTNGLILPLDGIELSGQYSGQSQLTFTANGNGQYGYYEVQFSGDGNLFTSVTRINATDKETGEKYNYAHTVYADKMYYRICGHGKNGEVKYSNVLMLRGSITKQLISVYPNPVLFHQINIKLFEIIHVPVDVTIFDLNGSKLYYNRFTNVGSLIKFSVAPSFARQTMYVLEVRYGETVIREKIVFG